MRWTAFARVAAECSFCTRVRPWRRIFLALVADISRHRAIPSISPSGSEVKSAAVFGISSESSTESETTNASHARPSKTREVKIPKRRCEGKWTFKRTLAPEYNAGHPHRGYGTLNKREQEPPLFCRSPTRNE